MNHPGHLEAQLALPWLANGRLAGTALERVWSHVQACAGCRADLALLHTMRQALRSAPGAGKACDAERALARLRPRLAPASAAATATPHGQLVIMFRPDTPEREVRRILREGDARIVGGPTAGDAYLVHTEGEPALVLARLRAEAAVMLAESFTRHGCR